MSYGFLLTTFNDSKQAEEAITTLACTVGPDPYSLLMVDGGSSPKELDKLQELGPVIGPYPNLSDALNVGIYALMGYNKDNIKEFVKSGISKVQHIIWIHTDMRFYDVNWAEKLVWLYGQLYPLVVKLGPGTCNIDNSTPDQPLRTGNQCPWVMSAEFLRLFIERYGYVFNPNYTNIGGYEDWQQMQEIKQMGEGYQVAICSLVDVWHKGAGIRFLRDTKADQEFNSGVYSAFCHSLGLNAEQPAFDQSLFTKEMQDKLRKDFERNFSAWYGTSKLLWVPVEEKKNE